MICTVMGGRLPCRTVPHTRNHAAPTLQKLFTRKNNLRKSDEKTDFWPECSKVLGLYNLFREFCCTEKFRNIAFMNSIYLKKILFL